MKKEYLLLLLLLLSFLPSKAQESVALTFTANTQSGIYCHFDAVNIINVTRGLTETIAYPDTTLVLEIVEEKAKPIDSCPQQKIVDCNNTIIF